MDHSWNRKRQQIQNECAQRGIAIQGQGKAYRLIGHGVDLMVTDLSLILPHDLEPTNQWHHVGRRMAPADAQHA